MSELPTIKRTRPVLIVCGIGSAVTLFPLGIANAILNSVVLGDVVNIVLALILLSLATFTGYYGFRLLKMVKNMLKPREEFIRKVKRKEFSFLLTN